MGTPEFPNLGKHCSVEECNMIDFLPFTCDGCNQVLCLEHRSYSSHQCPKANSQDVTVLVCPLCAKGVRLIPNEDPNVTWDAHVNADCDPSNYQNATKKARCPVPKCKEVLTFSNKIRCRDCNRDHCLKHRFGLDHNCPGPRKSGPFVGFLQKGRNGEVEPNWANNFLTAASSVRASAGAGISKWSTAANQALQKARNGAMSSWETRGSSSSRGSGNGALTEECLQCHARFLSVTELIDHVERMHQGGGGRVAVGVILDICPKCNREFQDPVSLVQHVEKDHKGTS